MSNLTRLCIGLALNGLLLGAALLGAWYQVKMYHLRQRLDEEKAKIEKLNTAGPLHDVIHANGLACPLGYLPVKGLFHERDGSRQDAYVRDDFTPGDFSVDVLMPGESIDIGISLPTDEDKPKEVL